MIIKCLIGIFILFTPFQVFADIPTSVKNIVSEYKNIPKKWHLISVRYRSDLNEFRFTYANNVAFRELNDKAQNYRVDSAFVKYSFISSSDSLFPASNFAKKIKRVQLMTKTGDKSNDWYYGIFNPQNKNTNKLDNFSDIQPYCTSCHQLAKGRGHVFSAYEMSYLDGNVDTKLVPLEELVISKTNLKDMPEFFSHALNGKNTLYLVNNEFVDSIQLFTIFEFTETLIQLSLFNKTTVGIIDKNSGRFAFAIFSKVTCDSGDNEITFIKGNFKKKINKQFIECR